MAAKTSRILVPFKLAKEIDALVGPRKRSAFVIETAQREVKRRRLLAFLDRDEPAWRDENHPDIAALGTAEWVRQQRNTPSVRLAGRDENLDPL